MKKVLTNLREAMRGGDFDYIECIHDMKILDQEILDLSPPSHKFEKKYAKKFLTHPSDTAYNVSIE